MVYQFVNMGPTEGQISDLLKGKAVLLSKDDQVGSLPIPLTKVQHARYLEVQHSGKSMRLKLSGPQVKAMRDSGVVGEQHASGFFSDNVKKERQLPLARMGMDSQSGNGFMDMFGGKLFNLFGGASGQKKIDTQLGCGFFDEYLLPGLKTAAQIGIPLLKGKGARPSRAMWQTACDAQMGTGWFSDYLLPTVKMAADIGVPMLKGRGMESDNLTGWGFFDQFLLPAIKTAAQIGIPMLQGKTANGDGWFSDYVLPAAKVAAQIGIPMLQGKGSKCPKCTQCGQGWNKMPLVSKKKSLGQGLQF